MTPYLVAPPVSQPVTLEEAKLHLRVDHDDEDALISGLILGAVGHLDGWRGVLGRAIMPQTWAVSVDCAGEYQLPMPDVTAAMMGGDALVVRLTEGGALVTATDAGIIEFSCALAAEQLPVAKTLVLLLVGSWYSNRDAVAVGVSVAEMPMAAQMLTATLRWRWL
jgi:hypothetical protein